MLNRIAVMLRGHVRTWKFIYPEVFEFYESIAKNVDYYFITWRGSQASTNITATFEGRILAANVSIMPTTDFSMDSYKASSYLAYMLLPYKRAREKTVTYDMVFDSRPDVVPVLDKSKHIFLPNENTFYTTSFDLHFNQKTRFYDVAVQDWFFGSTSKVYDIMAQRFITDNEQGVQITIRSYAESNGLHVNMLPYVKAYMARPNVTDIMSDGRIDVSYLGTQMSNWMLLDSQSKLDYCAKNNIVQSDYETGSQTCSI